MFIDEFDKQKLIKLPSPLRIHKDLTDDAKPGWKPQLARIDKHFKKKK